MPSATSHPNDTLPARSVSKMSILVIIIISITSNRCSREVVVPDVGPNAFCNLHHNESRDARHKTRNYCTSDRLRNFSPRNSASSSLSCTCPVAPEPRDWGGAGPCSVGVVDLFTTFTAAEGAAASTLGFGCLVLLLLLAREEIVVVFEPLSKLNSPDRRVWRPCCW